ncbi:protein rogdi-like [Littorina saxatilis]|uniref:Protein rogdi n=1 Tax=Littorina saxatilis TaxID=31220 RepID=A0AAN9AHT3_9CAEN
MADEEIHEEKLALRAELKWLLREEVHSVLDDIGYTLQECRRCFPMPIKGESDGSAGNMLGKSLNGDLHGDHHYQGITPSNPPLKILLTSASPTTPGTMKCVVTLNGDSISEADIVFKHKDKGKDNQNYKTSIMPEQEWKIQQVQDAANHLQEALQIASLREHDYQFRSAQEVLLLLEGLKKSVQACRICLSTPKRKSLQDLVNSKSREIFSPPIPQNVALSFYIHGSKVILAIYHLHINGQQKMDVSHRIQMEAAVQWLNEAVILFTLALQQCQQLVDKITTVCQCAGLDTDAYIT